MGEEGEGGEERKKRGWRDGGRRGWTEEGEDGWREERMKGEGEECGGGKGVIIHTHLLTFLFFQARKVSRVTLVSGLSEAASCSLCEQKEY